MKVYCSIEQIFLIFTHISEEEAEDPDRTIGFEDIQDYLFQFPSSSFTRNNTSIFNLILCFLRHFGVNLRESEFEIFGVLSTQTFGLNLELTSPEYIGVDEEAICGDIMQKVSTNFLVDSNLETFIRNVFSTLSKKLKEPFKTQIILLWLRFEKDLAETSFQDCSDLNQLKVVKKSKAKFIKNEVKNILDHDRENAVIYCGYADCIAVLEGYKNSWKIFKMLLETRSVDSSLQQRKDLLQIYVHGVINELKELKRLSHSESTNGESLLHQNTLKCHSDNARWLLTLAAENAAYKNHDHIGKYEMIELADKAEQKSSDWIHKQFLEGENVILHGSQGKNDYVETNPVTYYNEFTARVFIHAWLLYFGTGDPRDSYQFIEFVIERLQQNEISQKLKYPLQYVIELLHKIRIDMLLYDGSIKSIQMGKNAISAGLSVFPCNTYLLENVLLSNNLNIRTNVSSFIWRSVSTSLLKKKTPCQSYAISILVRFLLNKFLNREQPNQSKMLFDFKHVTESDLVSVGHLNQAHKILNQFVQENRDNQISSPVIWRLLLWINRIRHEIDPIKYPLANVKTIFYRACQDNPSAKVFFLDAMNYCESATKTDFIDLKGKYSRKKYRNTPKAVRETQTELQHLMTEKEIRVRIPMEEVQVMLEPEDMDSE